MDSFTKWNSNLWIISWSKVILWILGRTKWCLKCINIRYFQFLPKLNPSCTFFIFLYIETTRFIPKILIFERKHKRENTTLFTLLLKFPFLWFTTINESTFTWWMTVKITKHNYRTLFVKLANIFFELENLRWEKSVCLSPYSIKINSSKVSPIVSMNNSIWVEHGNQFKNKFLP